DLSNRKILLCDDVLTTGSTARRCSDLLKTKGADTVIVLVGTTTKSKI
ncbi:MAG: ComF family protein, partial [Clostridiales bacterium]|nr:ComF family protein [Clostridiales bacterium]